MRATLIGSVLLALGGCTLIVNSQVNGVSPPDGGGPTPDAGGTRDAGSTPDAGGDSGVLPPCDANHVNSRLRCDAPIALASGSVGAPWMATVNGQFLVAYAAGNGITLKEVSPAGTVLNTSQIAAGFLPPAIALASQGSFWALAWNNADVNKADLFCSTSLMDGGIQHLDLTDAGATAPIDLVGIAVSLDGGVAIEGAQQGDTAAYLGTRAGACPSETSWVALFTQNGVQGIAPVSLTAPQAGDDGWRYTALNDGYLWLVIPYPDAGSDETTYVTNDLVDGQVVSAATTGGTVFSAYQGQGPDGGNQFYSVAMNASVIGVTAASAVTLSPLSPGYWNSAVCPGSVATAFVPALTQGDLSVAFSATDVSGALLGSFDVACNVHLTSPTSSVAVSCAGGRIGVFFYDVSSTQAQLYLCDLPPLP